MPVQNKYMDAAAELGRNPVSTRFSLSMEMSRPTRDGTAETVSRDQIFRHERGRGNIYFPCSADHELDWQPYTVDPYSCYMCDRTRNKLFANESSIYESKDTLDFMYWYG